MFCTNCGNKIDENTKFCTKCGATVKKYQNQQVSADNQQNQQVSAAGNNNNANATAANANYANANVDNANVDNANAANANYANSSNVNANYSSYTAATAPAAQSAAPSAAPAAAKTAKTAKTSKKSVIAISISATLAVVLIIAGTLWYFLREREVVVPKFETSEKVANVTKTLASNGIKVQIVDEFSGKKPGSFLRYLNVKPNSHISSSYIVKVARSKGPGIPAKGIVGKSLNSAKNILQSMGVPVKVHYVASLESGKILASNPIPGYSVGKEKVIHIAVGDNTFKGVPTNLFGMDKDAAYKMMFDRSYYVKLRPRFSSRKYINKIVGAFPSLGSPLSGNELTLYYGVDASKAKDAFLNKDESPYISAQMNADAIAGLWCTKSGDCLDLRAPADSDEDHGKISLYSTDLPYDPTTYDGYNNSFGVCNMTHDPSNCSYSTENSDDYRPMKNHLLSGDSGVIEIYKHRGAPYCGNKLVYDSVSGFCVNGEVVSRFNLPESMKDYSNIEDIPGYAKGASFRMDEFLLLVPLNAKLDAIEKSGYFVGEGSKNPDMNRPFILRRDPKLYKETKVDVTNKKHWGVNYNPFVPTMFNKPVKFAPAPDDSNAYYLVEEPFDWGSIPSESL